ncbi:MAG: hypothetical protein AAB557_00180 [Patescibacteria group bacterium]
MANGNDEREPSAEEILARVLDAQAAAKKQAPPKKQTSLLDQYWSAGTPKAKEPAAPGFLESAAGTFAHEMGVVDAAGAGEAVGKAAANSLQQFLAQGAPASESVPGRPFSQRAAETVASAKTLGAELAKWGTIFAAAAGINTEKQRKTGESTQPGATEAENSSEPRQITGQIIEGEFTEL